MAFEIINVVMAAEGNMKPLIKFIVLEDMFREIIGVSFPEFAFGLL